MGRSEPAKAEAGCQNSMDVLLQLMCIICDARGGIKQAAMQSALGQRNWHSQRYLAEVGRALRGCGCPEWLVQEQPRAALAAIARALIGCGSEAHASTFLRSHLAQLSNQ
jgi:hypothetical protein